ncbi:MAG: DUF7594 domain-containing protein [bacterium]
MKKYKKNILPGIFLLMIFIQMSAASSCIYQYDSIVLSGIFYVDSRNGDDSNDGESPETAWKSLHQVNNAVFEPGSTILLKSGSIWTGQLKPGGEGSIDAPNKIDKYGEGPLPLIDGRGLTGEGVVKLFNQSFWEIKNLEITNSDSIQGDRRGVEIKAANYGLVEHIYLEGLHIHHISGIPGNSLTAKLTAGIYIATVDDELVPTRFHDVKISGCHIHHVENIGIVNNNEVTHADYPGTEDWNKRRFTDLRIENNIIHHISKNAIIVRLADGGIVEHNLCYETALQTTGNTIFSRSARGTVFQYNEGFLNRSPDYDGSLYDADLHSPEVIFQYSYSHNNAHGLFWMCTTEKDKDVIVRYNISRNDKGNIFCINYPNTSTFIYNNTVFIPEHLSPLIISERREADKTYVFVNNLIYNLSPTAGYKWFNAKRTISNNLYYGYHPANEPDDPEKITADPLMLNPGSGGMGLGTVTGYKLKAGSPAIGTGIVVPDNGGRDYFNNEVSSAEKPNIGFHNKVVMESFEITALKDAFITNGTDENKNFGTLEYLEISEQKEDENEKLALVSFDINELENIENYSAVIKLFCSEAMGMTDISMFNYDNEWNEETVNWTDYVSEGEQIGNLILLQKDSYYALDITDHIKRSVYLGETRITYVLKITEGKEGNVVFNSKENTSNPPVLEINVEKENTELTGKSALSFQNEYNNLLVTQNPFDSKQIIFKTIPDSPGKYNIEIFNLSGQAYIMNETTQITGMEKDYTLNLQSSLTPGLYIVRMYSKKEILTGKLFIQKS